MELDLKYGVYDVDETLVKQHSMELPSERFLQAAQTAGESALLGIMSARSLAKVSHILDAAKMRGFSALNNGAQIYNPTTGKMSLERALPATASTEILSVLQSQGVEHDVQVDGVDHWGEKTDDGYRYFRKKDLALAYSPDNRVGLPSLPTEKRFFIAVHHLTPDQIVEMRDIGAAYNDQHVVVSVVHETIRQDASKVYDIFFADERATKSTALEVMTDMAKLKLPNVMFTGDGVNDKSAVAIVGAGVAVGNASQATFDVATHIAPTWQHDGAAIATETLLSRQTS
jgi:HAD superfamily hydrolase (TIGR01484 family)